MDQAELVAIFAKHKDSPAISFDEYDHRKRLDLRKMLSARHAVFLDLKFWILIRDSLKKDTYDLQASELLNLLRQLVSEGRIFCPISESVFAEMGKQPTYELRLTTAQLIDELSLGISLVSYDFRTKLELLYWVYEVLGIGDLEQPESLVWTKLSCMLGGVKPILKGHDENTQVLMQKAFLDQLWTKSLVEILNTMQAIPSFQNQHQLLAERINKSNGQYESDFHNFAEIYAIEALGGADILAPLVASLVADMQLRQTGVSIDKESAEWQLLISHWRDLIFQQLVNGTAQHVLRTAHIGTCLHANLRMQKGRKFKANDPYDFQHAASALAYCQVFLTEKSLKAAIESGNLALDKKYGCKVISDINEAITYLSSFNA